MILAMLNSMAALAAGDEARMNDAERQVIQDSLQRIFERMDLDPTGRMAAIMDPLTILMGLTAWGIRITRLVRERRREELEQAAEIAAPEDEKPTPEARPNPLQVGPDGKPPRIVEADPDAIRAQRSTLIRYAGLP